MYAHTDITKCEHHCKPQFFTEKYPIKVVKWCLYHEAPLQKKKKKKNAI